MRGDPEKRFSAWPVATQTLPSLADGRRADAVVGQSFERATLVNGSFRQANEAAAHAHPDVALAILEQRSRRAGEPVLVLEAFDERRRGQWIPHAQQSAAERGHPDLVAAVAQQPPRAGRQPNLALVLRRGVRGQLAHESRASR